MRQIREQTLSKGKCDTLKPYAVAKSKIKYSKDEHILTCSIIYQTIAGDTQNCEK